MKKGLKKFMENYKIKKTNKLKAPPLRKGEVAALADTEGLTRKLANIAVSLQKKVSG